MITSGMEGGFVAGPATRYLPFGAWRTTPTQTLTDRGYTGHLENMEIGLVHNAPCPWGFTWGIAQVTGRLWPIEV